MRLTFLLLKRIINFLGQSLCGVWSPSAMSLSLPASQLPITIIIRLMLKTKDCDGLHFRLNWQAKVTVIIIILLGHFLTDTLQRQLH